MKAVRVEDCCDCGDVLVNHAVERIEERLSLTIFKNPAGLLSVFACGAGFYSAVAYAIWRLVH